MATATTNKEMATKELMARWENLVASGEWEAEEMAENLADQIEGYADLSAEEYDEQMAQIMGWEEELTDEQMAEWEEVVNQAATKYLGR